MEYVGELVNIPFFFVCFVSGGIGCFDMEVGVDARLRAIARWEAKHAFRSILSKNALCVA